MNPKFLNNLYNTAQNGLVKAISDLLQKQLARQSKLSERPGLQEADNARAILNKIANHDPAKVHALVCLAVVEVPDDVGAFEIVILQEGAQGVVAHLSKLNELEQAKKLMDTTLTPKDEGDRCPACGSFHSEPRGDIFSMLEEAFNGGSLSRR